MKIVRPDAQDYQDSNSFQNIAQTMKILSNHLDELLSTYYFFNNDSYCLPFNGRVIIKILSHYFSQRNQVFNFLLKLSQDYRVANETITQEELDILENYCYYMQKSIILCQNHPGPKIKGLLNVADSINKLFNKFKLLNNEKQTIDQYKLFIEKQGDDQITLLMVCLDPSIAFRNFYKKRVYSILITLYEQLFNYTQTPLIYSLMNQIYNLKQNQIMATYQIFLLM